MPTRSRITHVALSLTVFGLACGPALGHPRNDTSAATSGDAGHEVKPPPIATKCHVGASEPSVPLTYEELITNHHAYTGQRVRISGLLEMQKEEEVLYARDEDRAERRLARHATWYPGGAFLLFRNEALRTAALSSCRLHRVVVEAIVGDDTLLGGTIDAPLSSYRAIMRDVNFLADETE